MANTAPGAEPFEEVTKPTYAADFIENCRATQTARGVRLSGACPRCNHDMAYEYVDRYYKGVFSRSTPPAELSSGVDGSRALPMLCTCTVSHRDRPADEEGCGAYWSVEVSAE